MSMVTLIPITNAGTTNFSEIILTRFKCGEKSIKQKQKKLRIT